ncbi:MAG: hypothetical protein GYA14_11300 [Ignavibacteria bacterium]|nr:hypothetical protein [Ignavibacteria bacterium]
MSMMRGQNLFTTVMMLSFYPFLFLFMLLPQYFVYEVIALFIYFAIFFYVKTAILLKKREMIDGVVWLDSWTVRDLDYSEEILWGIEDYKLMNYYLDTDPNRPNDIERLKKECEELISKENPETYKKELNDQEKKVVQEAKEKTKSEMKGQYFYLIRLSQDTSFNDTSNHQFKKAILITRYPFMIEFNPSRLELCVDGYFAKARAAKCALNVEGWLTDDRPLVTVAWSESDTLEKKSNEQKEENTDIKTLNFLKAMRELIYHYENKVQRVEVSIDKLKKESEGWQDLYEE